MYRHFKKYNNGCAILCIFFPTIQISYLGIKCINLEPKTLVAFRRHESEATKWHLFGFFVRNVGTEIEIEACFAGIESAANVEKKIEGKKYNKARMTGDFCSFTASTKPRSKVSTSINDTKNIVTPTSKPKY